VVGRNRRRFGFPGNAGAPRNQVYHFVSDPSQGRAARAAASDPRTGHPLSDGGMAKCVGRAGGPQPALSVAVSQRAELALFFYDAPISRAVAFEGVLSNGDVFAQRL
jgi:hypothetical protein